MTLRSLLACVLILLMAAVPVPASAQTSPSNWHAVAAGLPPQALVTVQLVDGTRVQGYLTDVTDSTIVVQPRTRLRVAPRTLDISSIRSLAPVKAGTSPGGKVVKVIGGVGMTFAAIGFVMLMRWRD